MGLFALALPFLTWPQAALCAVAAFAFNWLILPRLLGHRFTSARAGVSDRGVLLYPLVVLALILLFRRDLSLAAFGWGVLAFGDAAAGVVGQKWGRHPLPWNQGKSWEGLVAFAVAGIVGGCSLFAWYHCVPWGLDASWHREHLAAYRFDHAGLGSVVDCLTVLSWHSALWFLVPVLFAGLVETVPHGLDDNVLPPLIAAAGLFGLAPTAAIAATDGLVWILGLNAACAVLAWVTRALRPGGIAAAWLLGVVTAAVFGAEGFFLLLVFLLLGLGVTFLGYGRKRATGVAESHGGRRGAAEVLGKGGVVLAVGLQVLWLEIWHFALAPASWVVVAILAAATADTWATELGGLWGRRAFTLVPWRRAAPGTSGAVSVAGLVAALAGAAAISAAGSTLGLLGATPLRVGVVCAGAAFVATLVESLLPRLGEASHVGKNLVVTLLAPILVFAVLGIWP